MSRITVRSGSRSNFSRSRIENPEEYAGYNALDVRGERIGKVEEIFVNDRDEPEYLRVRVRFPGFRSFLLPVETLAVNEERGEVLLE